MRTDGGVALVSGGASGLGRATAEALEARGAQVVIMDLPPAADDVEADGLAFAGAGVRDSAAVTAAVARATELGPLRMVVNCAGIGPPGRVLRKGRPLALEDFSTVVEINLIGTFNVVRVAAAAMAGNEPIDEERGVIINTASIAAFDGQVGQAAYAASKGGVVGMTLPLARDLASHQIRVMTIAPGTFATPMLAGLPREVRESLGAAVPHPGRLGDPSEYAALAVAIIENPMLNGEVIRLDGALRMAPR
jgi:NAD(P)-dependent dehydrogenase (short-subunit alcohol dehydrogenase family)